MRHRDPHMTRAHFIREMHDLYEGLEALYERIRDLTERACGANVVGVA